MMASAMNKYETGKRIGSVGEKKVTVLSRAVRKGLTGKITSGQRPEGEAEGENHVYICEKSIPYKRNKHKGFYRWL